MVKIQEVYCVAVLLEMKANKMNNSRLLKPSYKQVEEFIEMVNQFKKSIVLSDKYDITIQERVIDLKGMPTDSLTECETFAKELSEIGLLLRNNVPFWWRSFPTMTLRITFTLGEYGIFALILIACLII